MTEPPKPTVKRRPAQPQALIEGAVAKILTARELVINRGRKDGVRRGMKFQVLDPKAENVEDPETGEVLGSIERPKIEVQVTVVDESLAIAKTFHARQVNVGGMGLGLSGLAQQFEPPKYEKRYDTLKTDETTWEDLDESESFVKVGDPVRQIAADTPE